MELGVAPRGDLTGLGWPELGLAHSSSRSAARGGRSGGAIAREAGAGPRTLFVTLRSEGRSVEWSRRGAAAPTSHAGGVWALTGGTALAPRARGRAGVGRIRRGAPAPAASMRTGEVERGGPDATATAGSRGRCCICESRPSYFWKWVFYRSLPLKTDFCILTPILKMGPHIGDALETALFT